MRNELVNQAAFSIFIKQDNCQELFDVLSIDEKIEAIKQLETTFKNMFEYKEDYELFYNDIMSFFFHDYRNKMAYIDYMNRYVNNFFIEYNGSVY